MHIYIYIYIYTHTNTHTHPQSDKNVGTQVTAKAGGAQYSPETTRSRSQGGGAVRDPKGVGGWRLLRTHLMCE